MIRRCGAGFSLRRASARLLFSGTEVSRKLKPAPHSTTKLVPLLMSVVLSARGLSGATSPTFFATKLYPILESAQCLVPLVLRAVTVNGGRLRAAASQFLGEPLCSVLGTGENQE